MKDVCLNCKENKEIHGRKLCGNCYQKLMKLPNFNELYPPIRKSKLKKCLVEGCLNNARANGYCQRHYSQTYRNGEISNSNPSRSIFDKNEIIMHDNYAEIIIYTKNGYEKCRALIDLDDVDKVKDIKWSSSSHSYVSSASGLRLHRFIVNCNDDNLVVDHINRNPLDNRKCNLRICTTQENSRNKSLASFNTSGVIGVSYNKNKKMWNPNITVNEKIISLGFYNNKDEAITERLKAEVYYFGEFSPQIHMFEKYGIDVNTQYDVKLYTPKKKGNPYGIKGVFKGSCESKDKWKVEFTHKKQRVFLGYYNTLDEAINIKNKWLEDND